MKKIKPAFLLLYISLFQFFILQSLIGQTILFSEDFESGELPLDWNQTYISGIVNWRFENGGYTYSPMIPLSRNPVSAHGGNFNALFQFLDLNMKSTKLITKKISALEFAIKPELHFYQAQFARLGYNDKLKVYYKNKSTSPWTLLRQYNEPTSDWVERIILLPENDLSGDYYLAFEGVVTGAGYGTCVDDIRIIETGILPKSVSDLTVMQASDVSVASGTVNNPVLKIKLKVMGNSGTLPLNSLVLNSLNISDNDIEPGGVKLYLTQGDEFSIDNQIGTGVSFSSGSAQFNSLNYDLPPGYSYLWITYDIKPTAGHRNTIDASLLAHSITINGQTYLGSDQSPAGSRTILQTICSDDFESSSEWVLSGEFELGSPQNKGGRQGNPDPVSAFSGSKIIGTDLTGLGENPGDYEEDLADREYQAISDTLDFTYYNDLTLRFMKYLNVGFNDIARIEVSGDNGNNWNTVWSSTSLITDDTWKLQEVDISQYASRKKKTLIRYSLGTTDDYWQLSGWNIDDFTVTGKFVSKDVGIERIITPANGCGHSSHDSVTVIVKNYGATDSYGIIPLKYSINGGSMNRDTLYAVIPFGGSKLFKFKKGADLSVPDIYDLFVSTDMSDDDDNSNNGISVKLFIQPSVASNHTEKFESKGGLWISHPGSVPNWECGIPGFGIIPPSGNRVWMTQLLSTYPDYDSSFVESVCYSNEEGDRKFFGMKYWTDLESDKDGVSMQYSTDGGTTWQLLDTLMPYSNWYNDTLLKLDSRGWSGSTEGNWKTASIVLPRNLTDSPLMKFRMAFASDEVNTGVGFVFDDFTIFKAPIDIGATTISGFANACQYANPDNLTITIQNFGLNPIHENDTIIAAFDLNHIKVVVDTFHVSEEIKPGETFQHTFSKPVDDDLPGNYNLTVYTLSEKDPWFYHGNNDTTTLDFTVFPNPLTSLTDTIQTRLPDTVKLETIYDDEYDYWWNGAPGAHTYEVSDDGWQYLKVTATRGNGCTSYDSTNVELLFFDVGIDALINPVNDCGLSKNELVTVKVKNFGTDSISAGQKIAVCFVMNNGIPVKDTLLLANTLQAGHTKNFTFTKGAKDLSSQGMYDFKVYTSYDGDTIGINDTIVRTIEILGRPAINLGTDKIEKTLEYTLDAGTGYAGYEWDNGLTSQTRQITESGSYWVKVLDGNQCDNSDTIHVWLKIRDLFPTLFESPVSDCSYDPLAPVRIRILNNGNDTIPSGSEIGVSLQFQQSGGIHNTITTGQPVLPGQYILHTFSENVNLGTAGDYRIEASVDAAGDLRTGNDTLVNIIYRYDKPVVDFGMDPVAQVEDISVDLEAGYSPWYTYQWQDTVTMHNYKVVRDGLYYVKATDIRTLCFDRDTVMVMLIYEDVGVIWTDMPLTGCTGDFQGINVKIKNLGPSSIGRSAPIYLACDVNGTRAFIDTLTREGGFNSGATLQLNLSGILKVTEQGTSNIAFYTLDGRDKKPENDTLTLDFEALPAPVIDFGDDQGNLTVDFPYTLDAGPGYKSYLWQDNSTEQTLEVNATGQYTVTVTAMNDCQATKSVQVKLQSPVNELETNNKFLIYPNPGDGLFRLKSNDLMGEYTLRVYSNQGELVYIKEFNDAETEHEVDIRHLARGIYHLVINTAYSQFTGKIVIQ